MNGLKVFIFKLLITGRLEGSTFIWFMVIRVYWCSMSYLYYILFIFILWMECHSMQFLSLIQFWYNIKPAGSTDLSISFFMNLSLEGRHEKNVETVETYNVEMSGEWWWSLLPNWKADGRIMVTPGRRRMTLSSDWWYIELHSVDTVTTVFTP